MKLFPLIGALLLSTEPVHASKTSEELVKPCEASEETFDACLAAGNIMGSYYYHKVRCELCKAGVIPPEVLDVQIQPFDSMFFGKDEEKAMWNRGIKVLQKNFPNCSIKPIP